ncbi:Uncharacterised protein [Mycobacteroides abscessus subsp. abscessus]|nr:Uncharacterised protein [Mycobacteroides abscessus subsp. abscessus]
MGGVLDTGQHVHQFLGAQHAAPHRGIGPQAFLYTRNRYHIPFTPHRGVRTDDGDGIGFESRRALADQRQ